MLLEQADDDFKFREVGENFSGVSAFDRSESFVWVGAVFEGDERMRTSVVPAENADRGRETHVLDACFVFGVRCVDLLSSSFFFCSRFLSCSAARRRRFSRRKSIRDGGRESGVRQLRTPSPRLKNPYPPGISFLPEE
jgi:hypothetical protein